MTNLELLQDNLNRPIINGLSPFGNWIGYTMTHAEYGNIKALIEPKQEMLNPGGMVHGGILAAICDEIMGVAVFSTNISTYFVTTNLNIDFLFGLKKNDPIQAVGKVVRSGKTLIHVTCELYNSENILCAKASSNLVSTKSNTNEDFKLKHNL